MQVLLVTSSRRPDHWIVPGGGVEPEEEPSVTAIREVLEEAGVCGKLGRCLGVFEVTLNFWTRLSCHHGMAYPQVGDEGADLRVCRVIANIFRQSWTDKW
jgi:8-oxo-dGTP pyrophosphatase MutT (NUDIX family)